MGNDKKVILVTGAGRGLGEAIARELLSQGHIVVAADIDKPNWTTDNDSDFLPIVMNVTDENGVINAVSDIIDRFGKIDVLVNNAGISYESELIKTELSAWKKVFEVNTTGVFLCTREVVKTMLDKGVEGRIINISSLAGRNSSPGAACYGSSKAAIIGFTRTLAVELGPKGITANAICPTAVNTDMIQEVIKSIAQSNGKTEDEVRRTMVSSNPMGRFLDTKDVASLVTFLASEGARNINGETINLDGGTLRN